MYLGYNVGSESQPWTRCAVTVEKWTPERRMERTRSALIASARHVFATRRFEGASLDEIADEAGYTRGAIYRHFANKEDLFFPQFLRPSTLRCSMPSRKSSTWKRPPPSMTIDWLQQRG